MEILAKLGIDWKILIAQLINFGILAFVLTRFLYKPIIRVLENRKNLIEKGKHDAEEIQSKLKEAEKEKQSIIANARHESEKIMKKTESSAHKLKDDLLAETRVEQGKISARASKELSDEKVRITAEIRKDIGGLIHKAVEKSVGDVLDTNAREKLSKEAVATLERDGV